MYVCMNRCGCRSQTHAAVQTQSVPAGGICHIDKLQLVAGNQTCEHGDLNCGFQGFQLPMSTK